MMKAALLLAAFLPGNAFGFTPAAPSVVGGVKMVSGSFSSPSRRAGPFTRVEDKEFRNIGAALSQHAVFETDKRPVLLWDGTCQFCDAGIWTFIDNEKDSRGGRGNVRFATQESEMGLELLGLMGETPKSLNSVALIDAQGRAYTHSAACIYLSRLLRAPLRQVGALGAFLPKAVRDSAYNFIADHRHEIFGTHDSCRLPTDEQLSRFLTDL